MVGGCPCNYMYSILFIYDTNKDGGAKGKIDCIKKILTFIRFFWLEISKGRPSNIYKR
jgi:hypothetical protein